MVNFVAGVYGAKATRSTFNKVDRVEFNFVASVYRALQYTREVQPTPSAYARSNDNNYNKAVAPSGE